MKNSARSILALFVVVFIAGVVTKAFMPSIAPEAQAQAQERAALSESYDSIVWVCDDTRKAGTEYITIIYEGPDGITRDFKCDVDLDKGTGKKDKAAAIATAITKAAQNHGPPLEVTNTSANVNLAPTEGYKLKNPELTNNSGEKGNKEIKGAPDCVTTSVLAVGFYGDIIGYDGFGDESSIMVGWNGETKAGNLKDTSDLGPWVVGAVDYARSLGHKAAYGYDQHDVLWILVEVPPKDGSFVMHFGSTDLYLSQIATSWIGKLTPKKVEIPCYGYEVILW